MFVDINHEKSFALRMLKCIKKNSIVSKMIVLMRLLKQNYLKKNTVTIQIFFFFLYETELLMNENITQNPTFLTCI